MNRPDIGGIRYRANEFLDNVDHPVLGSIKDDALAMAEYIEYLEGILGIIGEKIGNIYKNMGLPEGLPEKLLEEEGKC